MQMKSYEMSISDLSSDVCSSDLCSAISGRAGRRWGRFEALPKNGSGGVLPLPHELRAQHQALDPVVAAVDFLRVAGQADRLDDGADLQRDRKSTRLNSSH